MSVVRNTFTPDETAMLGRVYENGNFEGETADQKEARASRIIALPSPSPCSSGFTASGPSSSAGTASAASRFPLRASCIRQASRIRQSISSTAAREVTSNNNPLRPPSTP